MIDHTAMASSRPRRERKAPERFGAYDQQFDSEVRPLASCTAHCAPRRHPTALWPRPCLQEEAPLRPRPAAKRRRRKFEEEESEASGSSGAAEDSGSEDEGGSSGGEEPESEAEAPPRKRQRGGGGGKGKAAAAAAAPSLKLFVWALPAQPVSRADFLATLHACPRLMGAWKCALTARQRLPTRGVSRRRRVCQPGGCSDLGFRRAPSCPNHCPPLFLYTQRCFWRRTTACAR